MKSYTEDTLRVHEDDRKINILILAHILKLHLK